MSWALRVHSLRPPMASAIRAWALLQVLGVSKAPHFCGPCFPFCRIRDHPLRLLRVWNIFSSLPAGLALAFTQEAALLGCLKAPPE